MKRHLGLVLLLTAAAQGAADDGTTFLSSSISVEDIHLSTARVGEVAHLQLRIRNDSTEQFTLMSAESTRFSSARFMARVGEGQWVEVGSVTIPADSTLDLGSSHLRVVIERLESNLVVNATVPILLNFVRGSLAVTAQVMEP